MLTKTLPVSYTAIGDVQIKLAAELVLTQAEKLCSFLEEKKRLGYRWKHRSYQFST